MQLNPLEMRQIDLQAKDLYQVKRQHHSSFLEPIREDILPPKNEWIADDTYFYLLCGICQNIQWKVAVPLGDYQGDVFFVGEDTQKTVLFYQTSYGTCNICDWYLDAIETPGRADPYRKAQELQDQMKRELRSFADVWEFVRWLLSWERKTECWACFQGLLMDCVISAFGLAVKTEFRQWMPEKSLELDGLSGKDAWLYQYEERISEIYQCCYTLRENQLLRCLRQTQPFSQGGLCYFLNASIPPQEQFRLQQETAEYIEAVSPAFPGRTIILTLQAGWRWNSFENISLWELIKLSELVHRQLDR